MNIDLELAEWRSEWLAEEAVPRIDLGDLVRRKTRRMRVELAAQLLWAVLLLGFSAWFASRRLAFEWVLWAAVIWTATFFAAGFAIWNTAGTWRALQESNAAFLDLSRRRCAHELRGIHIGRWALAIQLSIVAVWLSIDALMHRLAVSSYLFGIAVTILLGSVWLVAFARRERRIIRDFEWLEAVNRSETGS